MMMIIIVVAISTTCHLSFSFSNKKIVIFVLFIFYIVINFIKKHIICQKISFCLLTKKKNTFKKSEIFSSIKDYARHVLKNYANASQNFGFKLFF